jgi:hypothetical protein
MKKHSSVLLYLLGGGAVLACAVILNLFQNPVDPNLVSAAPTGQQSQGVGGVENIVIDLDPNMIPIYYNTADQTWKKADTTKIGNGSTYTTDTDFNTNNVWYNYKAKKWANAVTITATPSTTLSYYQSAPPGTPIAENDILGYWVYIPRYRYQIQRYSSLGDQPIEKPEAFNIQFENKDTLGYTKAVPEANQQWATHPAFTFGPKEDNTYTELNGIWIGKFETSTNNTTFTSAPSTANAKAAVTAGDIYIKPNQYGLNYQTIGQQWSTSINMSTNPDGASGGLDPGNDTSAINTTGTFSNNDQYPMAKGKGLNTQNLSASAQTRMLRNTDWGAVAYLATSSYGRNATEVFINNCGNISNEYNLRTGWGAATVSASQTQACAVGTNDEGAYNTAQGVRASTTDNIYGIYDMSGGNYEYTMSNLGRNTQSTSYATSLPQERYMDVYEKSLFSIRPSTRLGYPSDSSSSTEQYFNYDVCTFSVCGGQANYETTTVQSVSSNTQSWFSDYSVFFASSTPWAYRGGCSNNAAGAGLFYSSYNYGNASYYVGWRPALVNL